VSLRNVLIVTYHFPPSSASGSFRMLGFAQHLPRHGWRATVVAPPSLPWEPDDPGLLERVPAETSVYPVPFVKNRVARKLAPMACWLPRALRACRRAIREQRPDALLTSGPPQQVHWLGWWLCTRYGLPWAADFRDPWFPEGQVVRGRDFASRQEAAVMRAASAVIANAPGACRVLRAAYPQFRSKFVTLPNGYDRAAFTGVEPPPPAVDRPLRLVHTGAIYVGRDPRPVLDGIKTLADAGRADFRVSFFGPPPESDLDLAAEARRRGIEPRVEIAGQVPYAQCLREMVAADVLLLMDSPGRTVGVPAKLYEYLGAGRPVLALGERHGDLAWVLRQSGVPYRIAPPDNTAAVTKALADLAAEVRSGAGPGPGPRGDLHRFSREAIAGRLAVVLARCVEGRSGTAPGDDDHAVAHDADTDGNPTDALHASVSAGEVC
jgi:glycosyltransferase involved in cell wall biosynthesis